MPTELRAVGDRADTLCMLDYLAEELSTAVGWRRVLEAYASLSANRASAPPVDGAPAAETIAWVPRLSRLDGVEPEQLSALHGKLIALGLLTFEVSGKLGMQYQLSPAGKRALSRGLGVDDQAADEAFPVPADEAEDSELEAA
jgi:hypothetical protein